MSDVKLPSTNYEGPLSKRATRILRELKGLSVVPETEFNHINADELNHSNEPVLEKHSSEVVKNHDDELRNELSKETFDLNTYNRDAYGSLMPRAIIASVTLVFVVMFLCFLSFQIENFGGLKDRYKLTQNLTNEIKITDKKLESTQRSSDDIKSKQRDMIVDVADLRKVYLLQNDFLSILERNEVRVTSQVGTISQSTKSPLPVDLSEAGNSNSIKTEPSHSPTPISTASKPAPPSGNKVSTPVDSQLIPSISGDAKEGVNYYHVKYQLEGSFMGYLIARQILIHKNPGLIMHVELVKPSEHIEFVSISVSMSIPFVNYEKN
jgi:hypothetical protein